MHAYYAKAVRELDPQLRLDSPESYCAAMLLASLKHGAVDKVVIQKTKVPPEEGRAIAERLRAEGVWIGHRVCHSGWDDPKTGTIAFWLDVGIGVGWFRRAAR